MLMSIDRPGERHLRGSCALVDRVVDKEVHDGGSSEGVGSKLDRRDSYFARFILTPGLSSKKLMSECIKFPSSSAGQTVPLTPSAPTW
jgi:hypothetical protein